MKGPSARASRVFARPRRIRPESCKAHRLLKLEEQQVDDLRAALVEEKTRADKMNESCPRR